MSTPFISVDELKQQANITNTRFDEEMADYVQSACDIVEEWVGPITPKYIVGEMINLSGFPSQTWVDPLLTAGIREFALEYRPVIAVTALSSYPTGSSIAPVDLLVDSDTGIVRRLNGGSFFGRMTVDYSAGYTVTPTWASMAAKIIGAHLWRTQRGSRTAGQDDAGNVSGIGYLVPNQAAAILEPHRKMSGIG